MNEVKSQLSQVEKEMKEQRELMNSIMMMPKKVEYLVEEAKKDLVARIANVASESQGNVKELRDYIQTLHSEILQSVAIVKKIKDSKPLSSEMVANLSLEVAEVRRKVEILSKNTASKSSSSRHMV